MRTKHPGFIKSRYGVFLLMFLATTSGVVHFWKNPGGFPAPVMNEAPRPTITRSTDPQDFASVPAVYRLTPEQETEALTRERLVAISEKDGAAASLTAAKAITGPDRESQILSLLLHLSRIDPEFVAGELKSAGLEKYYQETVADSIVENWKDGKKALAWASSQLTGNHRKMAVCRALGTLVQTDSQAALAYLDTLAPSGTRGQAICNVFSSWGGFDPQAALEYAATLSPEDAESARQYVVGSWARTDPQQAAAWVSSLSNPSSFVIGEVVRNWPLESKPAAETWLQSLPESSAKTEALAQTNMNSSGTICTFGGSPPDESWKHKPVSEMKAEDLRNWGYQDPVGARRHLEQSPDDPALKELAITIAAGISTKESPAAAYDWAMKLPPELGSDSLRLAVIAWAGKDPATATEKIRSLPPERRDPLARAIAENWSRQDPAPAAAWVATWPDGNQPALVVEVLQQWTDQDPGEAYRWLGSLPAGAGRDEGIYYMIRREAGNDPESVVPWIDLISEPRLREERRGLLDAYRKSFRKKP